jgi:hypothetical protein
VAVRAAQDSLSSVLTGQSDSRHSDSGDGHSSDRGDHEDGHRSRERDGEDDGQTAPGQVKKTTTVQITVSLEAATTSLAAARTSLVAVTRPATNLQPQVIVAAEESPASSGHSVNTPSAEAAAEEAAAEVAQESHAAPADEGLAFAATARAEEQHPAAMPAPVPQESVAVVARASEVVAATSEPRVPRRAVTEAPDTTDPADLVWVTDADTLSPADGSPGVDAAVALQAGGHRLLPQRGSTVAPVATMLGEGAPEASAPAAADGRLNNLFINPLSVAPAAPTEPPAGEAAAKDAAYVEAETFLAPYLRPLLLVPLVGWCIVEGRRLWKRRKNLPRRRSQPV